MIRSTVARTPNPRRTAWLIGGSVLLPLAFLGCASTHGPPPGSSLSDGLSWFGDVVAPAAHPEDAPRNSPRVVVIRDRHPVHGAITRERGWVERVQRENRAAVGFLVDQGFQVMGCEAARGPLPTHEIAARHRIAVREALAARDPLHGLTVYQPIRYEEEFRGRLVVEGVEDPDIYDRSVTHLKRYQDARQRAARADTSPELRRAAEEMMHRAATAIQEDVHIRGQRAAQNLLELLRSRGNPDGILLMGGAHGDAAIATLESLGAQVWEFRCRSYDFGLGVTRSEPQPAEPGR